MPKFKVNCSLTLYVEANNEEQAIEQVEQRISDDLESRYLTEIFDMNAEPIEE